VVVLLFAIVGAMCKCSLGEGTSGDRIYIIAENTSQGIVLEKEKNESIDPKKINTNTQKKLYQNL
jgi:hypothetical protein